MAKQNAKNLKIIKLCHNNDNYEFLNGYNP